MRHWTKLRDHDFSSLVTKLYYQKQELLMSLLSLRQLFTLDSATCTYVSSNVCNWLGWGQTFLHQLSLSTVQPYSIDCHISTSYLSHAGHLTGIAFLWAQTWPNNGKFSQWEQKVDSEGQFCFSGCRNVCFSGSCFIGSSCCWMLPPINPTPPSNIHKSCIPQYISNLAFPHLHSFLIYLQ